MNVEEDKAHLFVTGQEYGILLGSPVDKGGREYMLYIHHDGTSYGIPMDKNKLSQHIADCQSLLSVSLENH